MGLATLNVWVHDWQDPCKISDEVWNISVTYCNGNVVKWCEPPPGNFGGYGDKIAKCGWAEFPLPPGCYIVWGYRKIILPDPLNPSLHFTFFFFTDPAIAIVNCDERACVHLCQPTSWRRFFDAGSAARFLAQSGKLPADKVERFVAATDDLLKDIPKTTGDAAREGMVAHLTEVSKKNPPK